MYLLLNRKLESLLATDAKEDFTLQAEQGDNQKLVYILWLLLFWYVHSLSIPPWMGNLPSPPDPQDPPKPMFLYM